MELKSSIKILNPADNSLIQELAATTEAEVNEAVDKACLAQSIWAKEKPAKKADLLRKLADLIENRAAEIAKTETQNVGKPFQDSLWEVKEAAHVFRFFAGLVEVNRGSTIPVEGGIDMTFPEPLGVVGAIVPWNFPFLITAWKVAPALACSNSVIVKPSELTPLSALKLSEISPEIGFPENLIQVLPGYGEITGRALVLNEKVSKISFTGSTEVGKQIMELGSRTIKRISLELGGKSAMIIFSDADLEECAKAAPSASFGNAGQDCCARSRILVEQSVFDDFAKLLIRESKLFKVGDPFDETCKMGPLISEEHLNRVKSYVDDPNDKFSLVWFNEEIPKGGNYYGQVITKVDDPNCKIFQEEVFGPVISLFPFNNVEEAISLANKSIYGLSGSVWTSDISKALKVARDVITGTISVNSNTSVRTNTPFGGFKQSGINKELGVEAMSSYSELKNVFIKV